MKKIDFLNPFSKGSSAVRTILVCLLDLVLLVPVFFVLLFAWIPLLFVLPIYFIVAYKKNLNKKAGYQGIAAFFVSLVLFLVMMNSKAPEIKQVSTVPPPIAASSLLDDSSSRDVSSLSSHSNSSEVSSVFSVSEPEEAVSSETPVSSKAPVVSSTPPKVEPQNEPAESPNTPAPEPQPEPQPDPEPAPQPEPEPAEDPNDSVTIYITKTGKRYHYDNHCNGGTYYESTLSEALRRGLTPCQKCVQ